MRQHWRRQGCGRSGWICRAHCCGALAQVTSAPLVRADMRRLPIRARSVDACLSLFTSFGYFESDAEHAETLAGMASTLRPGGWFVIDFLNAAQVRSRRGA